MNTVPERLAAALADRYRIERELGAGGMATVYLAHDLKHDRDVAIKVLHPELGAVLGAERFLTEIRTTANLQHPNILPLFDSGSAEGLVYYVMPFVAGETLRNRLVREQQLPVDEALRITQSVASALDYAHRRGVIHRDIKPENILLQDGQALVADFGIALAVSNAGGARITQTGISVGTPGYMSPEQAAAERELDGRSDVYSLGAVLFEMLVGEAPFTGPNTPAILAKLMSEPAPVVTVGRPSVPVHVAAAVAKCLEKVPADRFKTAADLAASLTSPGAMSAASITRFVRGGARANWRERAALPLLAVAVLALAGAAMQWLRASRLDDTAVLRIPVALDQPMRLRNTVGVTAQIAPNGRFVVYRTRRGNAILDLESGKTRMIPGTSAGYLAFAISPSSDSLVIRGGHWQGQLTVLSLATGQRKVITDSALNHEMSWSDDGWIYYGDITGDLNRVRSDGSVKETLIRFEYAKGQRVAGGILALPHGRGVIYGVGPWATIDAARTELMVLDLKTRQTQHITPGLQAVYLQTGHLVVVQHDGSLIAAPFDLSSLRAKQAFASLADSVEVYGNFQQRGSISSSRAGDLLYITPTPKISEDSLLMVDRDGRPISALGGWGGWIQSAALSPDGRIVAASIYRELGGKPNVWVQPSTGGAVRRLTFGPILDFTPTFSSDGRSVYFISARDNAHWDLYRVGLSGDADAQRLLTRTGDVSTPEVSADGRWVVVGEVDPATSNSHLLAARLAPDSGLVAVTSSAWSENQPALSRDGRWLAYTSGASGRNEIWVQAFPDAHGVKWQVTTSGASSARWSRDGRELFFAGADSTVGTVPVSTGVTFTFGAAQTLFRSGDLSWSGYTTPDDRQFMMIRRDWGAPGRVVLARNWGKRVEEMLNASRSNKP